MWKKSILLAMLILSVTVISQADTVNLQANIVLDPLTVNINQTITASWTVIGGKAPYSYSYYWFCADQNGNSGFTYGTTKESNTSFHPRFGNTGVFSLTVTDSEGRLLKKTENFLIDGAAPAPLLTANIVIPTSVYKGDTVTAEFTIAGGTAPYTHSCHWNYYDGAGALSTQLAVENPAGKSTTTVPEGMVEGFFEVRVTDSLGRYKSVESAHFTILERLPVLSSVEVDKTIVNPGESVTFTPVVSGGQKPYEYRYQLYKDGALNTEFGWTPAAFYTAELALPGEYYMRVLVRDDAGQYSDHYNSPLVTVRSIASYPVISRVDASKSAMMTGESVTFTPIVTGGVEPYRYFYRLWHNGTVYKEVWSLEKTRSPELHMAGEWQMEVLVEDADRLQSSHKMSPKVIVSLPPPVVLDEVETSRLNMTTGQSVTFTPRVSSGSPPYTYHYILFKDGVLYKDIGWINDASRTSTLNFAGAFKMQVQVKDAYKQLSAMIESPIVNVIGVALTADPKVSKTTMTPGETVVFSVTAKGGVSPYKYHFRLFKDGTLYKTIGWLSTNNRASELWPLGDYEMEFRVEDAMGTTTLPVLTPTVTVGVAAPLQLNAVNANKTTMLSGDSVTFTPQVTGGKPPYQYRYVLTRNNYFYKDTGWVTEKSRKSQLYPTGEWRVTVSVKDANGTVTPEVSSPVVIVNEASPLTLSKVNVNKTLMQSGGTVTFSASVSGGSPPYQYRYRLYLNGALYKDIGWQTVSSRSSQLFPIGDWYMEMQVRDAAMVPTPATAVKSPVIQVKP